VLRRGRRRSGAGEQAAKKWKAVFRLTACENSKIGAGCCKTVLNVVIASAATQTGRFYCQKSAILYFDEWFLVCVVASFLAKTVGSAFFRDLTESLCSSVGDEAAPAQLRHLNAKEGLPPATSRRLARIAK